MSRSENFAYSLGANSYSVRNRRIVVLGEPHLGQSLTPGEESLPVSRRSRERRRRSVPVYIMENYIVFLLKSDF